jgi:hypothetical protein
MTNMAGPIQQDAAKNDPKIVPILDMFSFFISVHHRSKVQGHQEDGNFQHALSPYAISFLLPTCAIADRIKWSALS